MEIVVPEEFRHLYERSEQRPVVKIPDPVLRQKAAEVAKISRKTEQLINEMLSAMKRANGIGLAAPQLGISQRVIVIAPDGMKPTALVNPRILKSEGSWVREEGCLSIPGLYGDVTRPEFVRVEAYDRRGRQITWDLDGMPARVVLHEVDHLDGVLFIDKVDPATLHWMDPDRESTDPE